MRYYVRPLIAEKIKNGWPLCDVYLPRSKADPRTVAIDIEIIETCFSCDVEFIADAANHNEQGVFCDECLGVE